MNDVEAGNPLELTRRGKPVAVVISPELYARLRSERPSFWEAYRRFLGRFTLKEAAVENDFFRGLRDSGTGRKVKW